MPDGPLHQRGGDRGVDSAGQPADRPAGADLIGDAARPARPRCCAWSRSGGSRPRPGTGAGLQAMLGVQDLRVELHAVQRQGGLLGGRHRRASRAGRHGEAGRRRGAGVAVRHPDLLAGRQPAEQDAAWLTRAAGRRGRDRELGGAVLAAPGALHHAAEPGHHQLEAVADAEHRNPGIEQAGRGRRGPGRVDGRRPAGQDDGPRIPGQHRGGGHGGRDDLGVHLALADPARDQLRVLGSEVDHENRVGARIRAGPAASLSGSLSV